MKNSLLLVLLGLGLAAPARADGMLDPAFGTGGIALVDVSATDRMHALAMMPDGRAVAAGTVGISGAPPLQSKMGIVRVLPSGALDPTFGSSGRVFVTFSGTAFAYADAVVTLPDGGVVVAGGAFSQFALVRLDANGALASTFGTEGKVLAPCPSGPCSANGVVVQPDGRIVAAGWFSGGGGTLMRFLADGTLDASFGTGGVATIPAGWQFEPRAIALRDDGRIVLGGTAFPGGGQQDLAAARLLPDGSPDPSFGGDGLATFVEPASAIGFNVLAQTGGAVIVGGSLFNDPGVLVSMARFLADGTPDPGFGTGGLATAVVGGGPTALIELPNGKLVQAGASAAPVGTVPNVALARYLPNGTLDATFGTAGVLAIDFAGSRDSVGGLAYAGPDLLLLGGTADVLGAPIFPEDFAFARFIATTPVALQSYAVE